ncbi:VIT domain-containing protein [Candidatus Poribacteria bacterium]
MRTAKLFVLCFIVFSCLVSVVSRAYADGIIIPPPDVQVAIKYHKVDVVIDNQLAITMVDQVFINQSPRQIEATYVFPLPEGVAMTRFVMYVGGEPLEAEFLDAEQARKIYEDIVRSRKDPAILEYMGRGAFRARVFPIMPWGEKRIQLEYSEILPYDAGLAKYQYPLNTEKFSSIPLEEVEVAVDLSTHIPIKNIWSPSHEDSIVVERQGEHSARIIYADENITPDIDFTLYYTVSADDFGLNLMTYREPPDDGFYVVMAAPNYEPVTDEVVYKNVIFVFDTSGSMASDNKIGQAKEALEFCVRNLDPGDQFNIIDFSTGVRKFKLEPVSAHPTEVQSALKYIEDLNATGGTNINEALLEALEQVSLAEHHLSMIIFLTDGKPTIGVTSEEEIIKNVTLANDVEARLFDFGVGYDVNTHLLDDLAGNNGGVSAYVRPEEDIEITVSAFFAKVSNPVLSDVKLDFGAINVVDRYPTQLPDLFAGTQIKEFGRYRNSGGTTITLSGTVKGWVEDFAYKAEFPVENPENDFIPRIWAARKIGYLIEEVRRNGETPELVEEIKDLSIKYGIINEYISMLILEDEPPPPGVFEEQFAADSGKAAVDASTNLRGWKEADIAPSGAQGENIKIVGSKIFVKKDKIWTDAGYEDSQPSIHVQYASEAYFDLLVEDSELGKYFALGNNVMFHYKGELYFVQDLPAAAVETADSEATLDEEEEEPPAPELWQNYPNPFNPDTWIPYKLVKNSDAAIEIYDVSGKLIRTLKLGYKMAGTYASKDRAAYWDGKNSSGEEVSSGVYFYIFEAGGFRSMKKMTLKK